jgi:DNA adenine methylase
MVEPFAGGASIGLHLVKQGLIETVLLNDLDPNVAGFWRTVFSASGNQALCKLIEEFKPTVAELDRWIGAEPSDEVQAAFRFLLRNRTSRGGVVAPGAGMLREGENGKGVFSRWYSATLRQRLEMLFQYRHRFAVSNEDALTVLGADHGAAFWFIDPPYTCGSAAPGGRLYTLTNVDHRALFMAIKELNGPWLLTEHDDESIWEIAKEQALEPEMVSVRNAHHKKTHELIFSSKELKAKLPTRLNGSTSTDELPLAEGPELTPSALVGPSEWEAFQAPIGPGSTNHLPGPISS